MGGRGAHSGAGFIAKGFPPDLLRIDYAKHRGEFHAKITKTGYNNKAKKLLNSPIGGTIKGFTTDMGRVYRYDTKEHTFAICEKDGSIAAFFKPTDKLQYWERQVALYGP
jgi:pyocin large subunit-like protein